jgi:hypothetical protein
MGTGQAPVFHQGELSPAFSGGFQNYAGTGTTFLIRPLISERVRMNGKRHLAQGECIKEVYSKLRVIICPAS